jgi:N-acetylmuramoyl-L-alanine amidase
VSFHTLLFINKKTLDKESKPDYNESVTLIRKGSMMFKTLALVASLATATSAFADNPDDVLAQTGYTEEEVTWLAKNVYFEARSQGVAGRLAVAMVTLNRVDDKRFPDNIQDVVTEGPTRKSWKTGEQFPIKHKCQFSWYCDGKSDKIRDWDTFWEIYNMMVTYLQNRDIMFDITEGATHYHADYVNPAWSRNKKKTIEIEDHKFYRWEK